MTQYPIEHLDAFSDWLASIGNQTNTIWSHRGRLLQIGRWHVARKGMPLSPEVVAPWIFEEYRLDNPRADRSSRSSLSRYKERSDYSPFLIIQHGRYGAPPKHGDIYREYLNNSLGYGAQLGTTSAWKVIRKLVVRVGDCPEEKFIGVHTFRHWFAQNLIDRGETTD